MKISGVVEEPQATAAAVEFEQFVRARTPALLRSAYLLTGDQQLAEDLVQEALARTHLAWHRLQDTGNADAYVRKIMYHHQVSAWRRRRVAESLRGTLPEVSGAAADPAQTATLRVALQRALDQLSPRQRAVIVLRYLEDNTEVQTAQLLGLSVGTVKTLANRGLERLRATAAQLQEAEFTDAAGTTQMHERALQRSGQLRRRRTAVASVAVALLFALVTVAAWQFWPRTGQGPVQPAETPTPTITPTVTQTPTEPVEPVTVLSNATLTFPDWPGPTDELGLGECPTGPVTFTDNRYQEEPTGMVLYVESVVTLNAGGEQHVLGQFSCRGPGEGSAGTVVAFRPVGDGFELVGTVVDTSVVTPEEGPWASVTGLAAGPAPGTVIVDLNLQLDIGTDVPWAGRAMVQQRTYGWNGGAYAQIDGPTSFLVAPAVAAGLSLTAEVELDGQVEFCRTGVITFTVTNTGPTTLADVAVAVVSPALSYGVVSQCQADPDIAQDWDRAVLSVGTLAPGAQEVSVRIVVDTRWEDGNLAEAEVRVGAQRTRVTATVQLPA